MKEGAEAETDKEGGEVAKRGERSSPWRREGRRIWRGGDGGRAGPIGVMDPRNQASAGPEETGAKAGVLGPGLSLLQQVGRWPLSLSSWVSNGTPPPVFTTSYILTGCCGGGGNSYLDGESCGQLIKLSAKVLFTCAQCLNP